MKKNWNIFFFEEIKYKIWKKNTDNRNKKAKRIHGKEHVQRKEEMWLMNEDVSSGSVGL